MKTTAQKSSSKNKFAKRRKDLIPIWIKPFIFLFMAFGLGGIYVLIVNLLGQDSSLSIYGLDSLTVFSMLGFCIWTILGFKTIVSVGLWYEKIWAPKLAIVDAVIGIIVCVIVMVVLPFINFTDGVNHLNIRFEMFLLVPYLLQMIKIKTQWEIFDDINPVRLGNTAILENKSFVEVQKDEIVNNDYEPLPIINKEDPSRFMPK